MGRFDRIYSDEQKDAILRAQLEDGMSAARACKAAKAGELYNLPPFDFNPKTAGAYATEERRKTNGMKIRQKMASGDPAERIKAVGQRMIGIVDARLDRLERRKDWAPQDVQVVKGLAQTLRELHALAHGRTPITSSKAREQQAARERDPAQGQGADLAKTLDRAATQPNQQPNGTRSGDAALHAGGIVEGGSGLEDGQGSYPPVASTVAD